MILEHRRIAWLLVLILSVPGLAYAVRQGRLIGKVVDPEGKPIEGVTVTATCEEFPDFHEVLTTTKKGVFKVDFDHLNEVYHYKFEKAGFRTTEAEQTWKKRGTARHEFVMAPGETPSLEGVPLASASNPAVQAFNAGVVAFKLKDYATAEAKLKEAAELDPYLRQPWEALSAIHLDRSRYQEAVEAAEKAMALGSTDQQVLRTRWEAYRYLGDDAKTDAARADLEKFGRLTEDAKRIYNEGVKLREAGDDAGAFARFQEALKADPNLQVALLATAATGLKIDRPAEALAAAETLLEADAQNAEALKARYNAALMLGDEAKVIEALKGLATIDATTARDSLYQLASAAYDRDDIVTARERFDLVLELDPKHPRSHYFIGLIYMRDLSKESQKQAKTYLERFIELAPDDPEAATAGEILRYMKGS